MILSLMKKEKFLDSTLTNEGKIDSITNYNNVREKETPTNN